MTTARHLKFIQSQQAWIIRELSGRRHSYLKDTGKAEYVSVTDDEAVDAFNLCTRLEGIIPALEASHAIAYTVKFAPTIDKDKIIVINLSGSGDKDSFEVAEKMGIDL